MAGTRRTLRRDETVVASASRDDISGRLAFMHALYENPIIVLVSVEAAKRRDIYFLVETQVTQVLQYSFHVFDTAVKLRDEA